MGVKFKITHLNEIEKGKVQTLLIYFTFCFNIKAKKSLTDSNFLKFLINVSS
jgi:hypothetical protein